MLTPYLAHLWEWEGAYYEKEEEMPMFKVVLDATVEVEVEAENAEQAREKALAEADEFDAIQSRGLSILPTVLSVEEIS